MCGMKLKRAWRVRRRRLRTWRREGRYRLWMRMKGEEERARKTPVWLGRRGLVMDE